jgi:uncharacterized protein (DUF983 family)
MRAAVNVTFACPNCENPSRVRLSGKVSWQCPACDHRMQIASPISGEALTACAVCGNLELYKKKDFPHGLGLTILVMACIASVITYAWYEKWLTWAILIGTAVFDGLLYLLVGDVVVCYRCQAQYRKLTPGPQHRPFELGIAERYRQERIRREQLQAERKANP